MKRCLGSAFVIVCLVSPLHAQGLSVVGAWLGDAPAPPGKRKMKVEITIKNDNGWSIKGILYEDGKELTTFTGKDIKATGVKSLEFTEEFEKLPAEWSAKPTKVTVQALPGSLKYDRVIGKKLQFATLRPKTPESFDQIVLGKRPPPAKNTATGAPIPSDDPNKLLFGVGPLHNILFTADGKTMVTADGGSIIRIWDFEARKQKRAIVTDLGLSCLAMTPDASLFAAGIGHTLVIFDGAGKEVSRFGEHIYGVSGVALTRDGKTLISTDDGVTIADRPDGNTKIWDVASSKEIANIPYCGKLTLALPQTADRFVFLNGRYVKNPANPLNSFVNFYKAYDIKGKLLYEKPSNHQIVRHTAVSPDQKLVLSVCLTGNINLLNLASGKIERTIKNKVFDYMNTVAFTPDGKQFAVGGSGGHVVFFETATGKQLSALKVGTSEIRRMAISPDGRWLISYAYQNEMVLTPLPAMP